MEHQSADRAEQPGRINPQRKIRDTPASP